MKKSFAAIALSSFCLLIGQSGFSQNDCQNDRNQLEVKFSGGDNEILVFDVRYENTARGKFHLTIIDENNEVLFREQFKGRELDKTLRVPRLSETGKISFLVKSPRVSQEICYQLNVTEKIVERPNTNGH